VGHAPRRGPHPQHGSLAVQNDSSGVAGLACFGEWRVVMRLGLQQ
jgi:hypothetical protein